MVRLIGGRETAEVPSRTTMSDVDRACSMASPSVVVPAHTAQIPNMINTMLGAGIDTVLMVKDISVMMRANPAILYACRLDVIFELRFARISSSMASSSSSITPPLPFG